MSIANCPLKIMMKKISLPSRLWYENTERELTFPGRWQVDNLTPCGFDKPDLSRGQIKEKVDHPLFGDRKSVV